MPADMFKIILSHTGSLVKEKFRLRAKTASAVEVAPALSLDAATSESEAEGEGTRTPVSGAEAGSEGPEKHGKAKVFKSLKEAFTKRKHPGVKEDP